MKNNILFFVNSILDITLDNLVQEDILYNYTMNFLSEATQEQTLKIILEDPNNNIVSKEFQVLSRPTKISVLCTPFVYTYNWKEDTYIKINYKILDLNNTILYTGSFPLITPEHQSSLSFGAVSCNNNQNQNDLNDYNYQYPETSSNLKMWQRLSSKNLDILFFLGNQIYSDYIIENEVGFTTRNCNLDEIYDNYSNLYKTAFSETYQSEVMRNTIVISLIGDHDVGFTKLLSNRNNLYLKSYYIMGMKAFNDYCNSNSKFSNYFNLTYGKYTIVAVDTFVDKYNKNILFTDSQLNFITTSISKTLNNNIILLSSRPLGDLNCYTAYITKSKLDLFHPENYENSLDLLATLDFANLDRRKELTLFSGGLERTYTNSIYSLYNNMSIKPILNQLVVGTISRKPLHEYSNYTQFKKWLTHKLVHFNENNYLITSKENYYLSNSFGLFINNFIWSNVDGDGVAKESNLCFEY